jgi:hypothetical protein
LLPLGGGANPVAATIDGLDDRVTQVAATASGHIVAAAATCGRTVIADVATGSVSLVPGLRHIKDDFYLVPVGDHAFLLIRYRYDFDKSDPSRPICDLLFSDPSGGGWACCSLPDPPGLCPSRGATGFFVAGAHVWVSLGSQGTFSFDTVRRQWRTQGPWELPLTDQSLFVPDFLGTGRNLLFGFVEGSMKLCACDMDATPPVIISSWPETCPDRSSDTPYLFKLDTTDLTYFGDGRFCISLNVSIDRQADGRPPPPICRRFVSFLAVEITSEMKLIKRRFARYALPPRSHVTFTI